MKLNFDTKNSIISSVPTIDPVSFKDLFIFYTKPFIHVAAISGEIIKKIKFEDVQLIKVFEGFLYICTSDVFIIDLNDIAAILESKELKKEFPKVFDIAIKEHIKLSKVFITHIDICSNELILYKLNRRINIAKNGRKVHDFEATNVERVFIGDSYYGYYTNSNLYVYNKKNELVSNIEDEFIGVSSNIDFVIGITAGRLYKTDGFNQPIIFELKINLSSVYFLKNTFYGINNTHFFEISYKGAILIEKLLESAFFAYSGHIHNHFDILHSDFDKKPKLETFKKDDAIKMVASQSTDLNTSEDIESESSLESSYKSSQESFTDQTEYDDKKNDDMKDQQRELKYELLNESLIKSDDNCYYFHKDCHIYKIISFADNITGSCQHNGQLFISTSNGNLILANILDEIESILTCKVFNICDNILSLKIYKNLLFVVSEKCVFVYYLGANINYIFRIGNHESTISGFDILNDRYVLTLGDGFLLVFKGLSSFECESEEDAYNAFKHAKNISTQAVHDKNITSTMIDEKYIITGSSDKKCKIFDHDGVLIKEIQTGKILNICSDTKNIAICGHKSIKVLRHDDFTLIQEFQTRPILSSCFYKEYLLAVSDVLRIYDINKKKCVKAYDLNLANCWTFAFPYLCAENKIVFLRDISKQVEDERVAIRKEEKEAQFLMDRFIANHDYVTALQRLLNKDVAKDAIKEKEKKTEHGLVRELVCKGYHYHKDVDFLFPIMRKNEFKSRIYEIFLKGGFKNIELFCSLVTRYKLVGIDSSLKESIEKVTRKYEETVENLYLEFIGMDILDIIKL